MRCYDQLTKAEREQAIEKALRVLLASPAKIPLGFNDKLGMAKRDAMFAFYPGLHDKVIYLP